jgi:EAL domain-containing protein (putative c-di-GMP-specific phosphodiesterase class I)
VLETACTQAADWVRRFGAAAPVVAEGIRTVRQRDILTDLGCTCGQGWLWHPAVSGEQIGTLLSPHGRSSHRRR